MPTIILKCARKLTKEQKEQIVKEYTEATSRVIGASPSRITVFITEFSRENVGVGGELLANRQS